jgi:membrane protein DedA with SNARE-associated domain
MFDWLFQSGSYLGIFGFMVLTGCGLPLPEEVAIVFAGVRSAQGQLITPIAFAACLAGALLGDAAMYGIGRKFGHSLVRRHPKLAKLVHAEREEHFERAILKHGFKVLLITRFMVGVRGPVYLAAGVVRMPFRKFLLWDLICATIVVGAFFAISHYLGTYLGQDRIGRMVHDTELTITLVALVTAGIVAFVALRRHRRKLLDKVLDVDESESGDADHKRPADAREAS